MACRGPRHDVPVPGSYLPLGDLRAVLSYPTRVRHLRRAAPRGTGRRHPGASVQPAQRNTGLGQRAVSGNNSGLPWHALLHRPKLIFLDESTSALDGEQRICTLSTCAPEDPGRHRRFRHPSGNGPTAPYHLELLGDGAWAVHRLADTAPGLTRSLTDCGHPRLPCWHASCREQHPSIGDPAQGYFSRNTDPDLRGELPGQ